MSKLELKHLAPYLPYKLKCQYEGIINGKELSAFDKKFRETDIFAIPKEDYIAAVIGQKVAELKEIKVFKNYWTAHIGVKRRGLKTFVNGRDFKPILHPLSDLVKPCLPDERTPAEEMEDDLMMSWCVAYDEAYEIITENDETLKAKVKMLPYDMVEWLFEHHFDVYGLVEQDLAADINALHI